MTTFEGRCIGLEQEFFLVDAGGALSDRADDFLARCTELARSAGRDPEGFFPECARCMVEINTPPAYSLAELSREYLLNLDLAIAAARDLDLRLYPLATYPLKAEGSLRDEPRYALQAQTVGRRRFENAGRCAGVHLHLEAAAGTVDPRVGVSYDTPRASREELKNLYNLATAFDPAIVALSRSGPFYEGEATGLATRTARYRGDPGLSPDGLYAELALVGGLLSYSCGVQDLVEQQFARYHCWLAAMDRAGVDRRVFERLGGGLLHSSSWNPVRLNAHGTVELRGMDSNYPETVLAILALVKAAADRMRRENLEVVPAGDLRIFEVDDGVLRVPGFEYLSGDLFQETVSRGVESPAVAAYLDSVFEFAAGGAGEDFQALKSGGSYRTTEADILKNYPADAGLTRERGLDLVLEACGELETQVSRLKHRASDMAPAGERGD
ncbi:MAG TPA: glutamate-cysteine ligase family protein [Rubrobacteraceae bacterium]|nr:glutamate-cysteine ligase family protein [Rubrobacteraceae bacterium]